MGTFCQDIIINCLKLFFISKTLNTPLIMIIKILIGEHIALISYK